MLGRILLLLVIQLAKQGLIYARPSHDPGQTGLCPSTGLPSGGLRHLNVIHEGKPKYRLDLKHTRSGYVPGQTYTIDIRAQDPSQTFGDVLLSVSSESRTCQHGNFSIQSEYYYQPQGCDHIVLKNTREFEHSFTFHWTAPTCGCVNLRARVKSADNIYYLDNENVIDGYLTKRVCRRHMSTIISKISHSERENLLCHVVSRSDDQIANEGHFLQRRKMDLNLMTVLERDAFHISLHQRVYQVQQCCVLTGTAKTDCLGDIRRHRIDRLCTNTLHMPFSVRSNAYMTDRRDNCCWRLGERRYDCFAMGHQGEGVPPQSDVHTDVAMVTGVNVLDESDPVNDLEDYPNRLSEELVQLNTYHEELEPENKDEAADKGKVHHTDLIPTLASNVHKDEKIAALSSHKTNRHMYQPVTQEVPPLQSPPKEDLVKMVPTLQTQSLTQTTAGLEKKLLRAKVELECCQQGKEYGVGLVTGDTWDRCEQRTRKVTKAMKGKNRRWCRRYHMRCCVESVHSLVNKRRWMNSMKPITSHLVSIDSLLHMQLKVGVLDRKTLLTLQQLVTTALNKTKKLHLFKNLFLTEMFLKKEFLHRKQEKNQRILKMFNKTPMESKYVTEKMPESGDLHDLVSTYTYRSQHIKYSQPPNRTETTSLPLVRRENSITDDHHQETGKTGPQRSEVQSQRVKVMTGWEKRNEKETDNANDDDDNNYDVDNDNSDDDDDDDYDDNDDDDEEIMDDSEETRNTVGDKEDSDVEDVEDVDEVEAEDVDEDIENHQENENTTPAGQRSGSDESQVVKDGERSSSVTSRVKKDGSLAKEQHGRPIIHSYRSTDQPQGSMVSKDESREFTDQPQRSTVSTDQPQRSTVSTDHSRGSMVSKDHSGGSTVSKDHSGGSTDQVFSELPQNDNKLTQNSDLVNDPRPVEIVKPSSGQHHSGSTKGERKLRRRKQPKSTRKGRKSRRRGRKNRRQGRKQIAFQ